MQAQYMQEGTKELLIQSWGHMLTLPAGSIRKAAQSSYVRGSWCPCRMGYAAQRISQERDAKGEKQDSMRHLTLD